MGQHTPLDEYTQKMLKRIAVIMDRRRRKVMGGDQRSTELPELTVGEKKFADTLINMFKVAVNSKAIKRVEQEGVSPEVVSEDELTLLWDSLMNEESSEKDQGK